MNMSRIKRRITPAALLTIGAVLTPVGSWAAPPEAEPVSISVGQAQPAPVASGTVRDSAGNLQAGADVVLVAWPSDAELASLLPGDPVNIKRIGMTRTDANGHYSLRPDYDALKAWGGSRSGPVNVEIIASTSDSIAPYATTISFDTRARTSRQIGQPTAETDGVFAEAAAMASGALGVDLQLQPAPESATKMNDGAATETVGAAAAPTVSCMTYKQDYGPRWVRVGQLYSTASSGFTANYSYSTSASSTLGAGYSLSGAYGSFTQSGSSTSASSSSVGFSALTTSGGKGYSTQFRYGLYYGTGCSPSNIFYYRVLPTGFVAGASTGSLTVPAAGYCTTFGAGSSFTKTTTNAVTWSDGVKISGAIGIDLSAKTGYSSTSKLSYSFSAARSLCGTTDYPGGSPSRLVVK